MHNKQVNRYGFTLAELMAVVVIISLMAVLSVGYYRRSIEQSRFAEGLMAASAVAEGINRYHVENPSVTRAALQLLDTGISQGKACTPASNYCVQTKHFEVKVDENGVTTAQRNGGTYANAYSIQIQPHFVTSNRDRIACVGLDNAGNGKAFCEGMGYTTCSNTGVCTKPL